MGPRSGARRPVGSPTGSGEASADEPVARDCAGGEWSEAAAVLSSAASAKAPPPQTVLPRAPPPPVALPVDSGPSARLSSVPSAARLLRPSARLSSVRGPSRAPRGSASSPTTSTRMCSANKVSWLRSRLHIARLKLVKVKQNVVSDQIFMELGAEVGPLSSAVVRCGLPIGAGDAFGNKLNAVGLGSDEVFQFMKKYCRTDGGEMAPLGDAPRELRSQA